MGVPGPSLGLKKTCLLVLSFRILWTPWERAWADPLGYENLRGGEGKPDSPPEGERTRWPTATLHRRQSPVACRLGKWQWSIIILNWWVLGWLAYRNRKYDLETGCDPSGNLKYAALGRKKTWARAGVGEVGDGGGKQKLLKKLGNQWERFYWMLEKGWPMVYGQKYHLLWVESRNRVPNEYLALALCFLIGQWKCHSVSFCWMWRDLAGGRSWWSLEHS